MKGELKNEKNEINYFNNTGYCTGSCSDTNDFGFAWERCG